VNVLLQGHSALLLVAQKEVVLVFKAVLQSDDAEVLYCFLDFNHISVLSHFFAGHQHLWPYPDGHWVLVSSVHAIHQYLAIVRALYYEQIYEFVRVDLIIRVKFAFGRSLRFVRTEENP